MSPHLYAFSKKAFLPLVVCGTQKQQSIRKRHPWKGHFGYITLCRDLYRCILANQTVTVPSFVTWCDVPLRDHIYIMFKSEKTQSQTQPILGMSLISKSHLDFSAPQLHSNQLFFQLIPSNSAKLYGIMFELWGALNWNFAGLTG